MGFFAFKILKLIQVLNTITKGGLVKIVQMDISKLATDPNNARKHDEKNIDAIKGSLLNFGQQKPLVVTKEGVILAGNGTYRAAKELGWKNIAVHVTDLDGFNATAFALADNRSAELASWDDNLGDVISSLQEFEFNVSSIGFSKEDIAKLTAGFEFKDPGGVNMSEDKFEIRIICRDEAEQQDLFLELRDRGFKVKA